MSREKFVKFGDLKTPEQVREKIKHIDQCSCYGGNDNETNLAYAEERRELVAKLKNIDRRGTR